MKPGRIILKSDDREKGEQRECQDLDMQKNNNNKIKSNDYNKKKKRRKSFGWSILFNNLSNDH